MTAALATAVVVMSTASTAVVPLTATPVAKVRHDHVEAVKARLDRLADRNQQRTRREVQRLLSVAPIPPDAVPTDRKAARLGPALGTPMTDALIDRSSYWQVDLSFRTVWHYLLANPPAGMSQGGESRGQTADGPIRGIAWWEHDTSYAEQLQTEVTIAPDGSGGTYLEADGLGEWLDPRPFEASPGRHPMRVTVSDGCPRSDRRTTGVANPGQRDLEIQLVPRRAPAGALICQYEGMNGPHAFRLRREVRLGRHAAGRLVDRARDISFLHVDGGSYSCPIDFGFRDVIAFTYRNHPDVDLTEHVGGCGGISNGHIGVTFRYLSLRPWARPLPYP